MKYDPRVRPGYMTHEQLKTAYMQLEAAFKKAGARVAELEAMCREVRAVILKLGEWDEGCFYFQGKACPEFERPLRLLGEAAMGREDAMPRESGKLPRDEHGYPNDKAVYDREQAKLHQDYVWRKRAEETEGGPSAPGADGHTEGNP